MQANIEKTLTKLIAFPSVSTNTNSCRDIILYTKQELEELGLFITAELECEHPWLLATTQNTNQPKILLAAHLDTVPASFPEQFIARIEDGKLHGRGAWDMKFAAACFIELLKAKHHDLARYDIGILFTTDEELGGHSVLKILKAGLRTQVVILPDSAMPWVIEQRAKGIVQAQLVAHGTHGHASRPWENENAFHKLLPVLETLRKEYPSLKPEGLSLSITIANAGKPRAINLIPDKAEAYIDVRAFERAELNGFKERVQALAMQHDLVLYYYVNDQPLALNKNNQYIESFIEIMTEQRGTALFADAFGASDGRHFAAYDIPCIIVSPRGNGFHQADEWVDLNDLTPYCKLLETYIFDTNLFLIAATEAKNSAKLDGMLTR